MKNSKSEPVAQNAPQAVKQPYTPPRLTEYGSVAKLTMTKGSTLTEFSVPNSKRACL